MTDHSKTATATGSDRFCIYQLQDLLAVDVQREAVGIDIGEVALEGGDRGVGGEGPL